MRNDYSVPWVKHNSGSGIIIKSSKGNPLVFIYGENAKSDAIAQAIVELEFKFQEKKEIRR